MAKNYFAIVHKKTGSLLVNSARLPIYFNKSVAMEHLGMYKENYTVKPVNIKELEKLIYLSEKKKAK